MQAGGLGKTDRFKKIASNALPFVGAGGGVAALGVAVAVAGDGTSRRRHYFVTKKKSSLPGKEP